MSKTNPNFVLTPEQRARLIHGIDVDALERFVRLMPEDEADRILASFTIDTGAASLIGLWGNVNPDAVAALEEVWAPTWEEWGLEVIEKSPARLPGRAIARARLAQRRADSRSSRNDGGTDQSR